MWGDCLLCRPPGDGQARAASLGGGTHRQLYHQYLLVLPQSGHGPQEAPPYGHVQVQVRWELVLKVEIVTAIEAKDGTSCILWVV